MSSIRFQKNKSVIEIFTTALQKDKLNPIDIGDVGHQNSSAVLSTIILVV